MRKDEFKYSSGMFTSSGCLKTPSALSSSDFCWSSSSWWRAYWGSLLFRCGGSTGPMHVYFGIEGAFCTVVAFDVRVEDVVVSRSDVNFALISLISNMFWSRLTFAECFVLV